MARRPARVAGLGFLFLATTASADSIVVSLLTTRAGPAAAVGERVANGLRDYVEMLNQRDGGIAGQRLDVMECETGSEVDRALACMEAAKAAGAVVVGVPDRAMTQALVDPSARHGIPLLSFADGYPIATRGDVMPWVFNPSASVLGGITVALRAVAESSGRETGVRGLAIGLAYSTAGADPAALDLMRDLATRDGFSASFHALADEAKANRETLEATGTRRPDYLILLGQGIQSGTAAEEALEAGFPPERLLALRWPDDSDLRRAGTAARGFREVGRHAFGDNFPAFDEIDVHVIDRGLSRTPKDGSGETHYNRGVYNGVLLAEAIRARRKRRPDGALTGDDVRRALESLSIDKARWKELGLAGFARAVSLDCTDHGGTPDLYVLAWDGAKWRPAMPPVPQDLGALQGRIDRLVAEFRAAHPDWPARTEPCEHPK
ncbi:ABC transporter substrate-binding protein [uncultured Methylobacterium sp.]|uniref:ABC transporter substrate-binding protein n=1 Tax=uncultured Methylobacterium sp. TaxID=157278 RepID=UPI0035CC5745